MNERSKQQRSIPGTDMVYTLEFKRVKNVNLRILKDGKVCVSAPLRVTVAAVDDFVGKNAQRILEWRQKLERLPQPTAYFTEKALEEYVRACCARVYPYFAARGVKEPQIKFRKMVSQWGNCRAKQGILTFSKNLCYAPPACVDYVVMHEFTHFLQQNHSKKFYAELLRICPEAAHLKAQLANIRISG